MPSIRIAGRHAEPAGNAAGANHMRFIAVLVLAAAVCGCTTLAGPAPLTRDDVVRMSRAGDFPRAIIDRLRQTGTVISLSASDIVKLNRDGVSEEVLDHLQQAQFTEMRHRDALLFGYPPYGYSPYACGWRYSFQSYWTPYYSPWGFC